MEKIKRVLLAGHGKRFYVRNLEEDFHTQYGFIKAKELKKSEGRVKTNTGKELAIFNPSFIDAYRKIKRDAQIIPLKDIGLIIAETGIGKESKVVDAGAGSGALACLLAHLVKEATTYEIREDFINLVKANIELLGLKNLKIRKRSIYEGIIEKDVDLVVLDVPEPWKAIDAAKKALKAGGFLVSYSPSVPQTMDFVNAINKDESFVHIKTSEVIEREWEVNERKVRPKSKGIGHSGLLSFCRRI
jgi:tRNA (adenine57-N1/adenine58-N1)-methyltransferase